MFEVGPTVSDPPGSHVKNIADAEHSVPKRRADPRGRDPGRPLSTRPER